MNPISILNNEMSTFLMATQQVFELWNDKVSDGFKNTCVEQIKRDWNSYLTQLNTRMNLYMKAELKLDEDIKKLNKIMSRDI